MISPERSTRSDIYAPKQRLSALGQGYSVFVKILKFALPMVALVIIGVLISRLSGDPQQQKLADMPKDEKTTPGQIEIIQAKYEGVDSQGRAYTVSADKAERDMKSPDSVVFTNPLAKITLANQSVVSAKSKNGSFDRQTDTLILKDDVTVFNDGGYEMLLQDIVINLKEKIATTSRAVRVQGPMGALTAQSMDVKDQGDLIVFNGPALLTIFHLSPRKVRG